MKISCSSTVSTMDLWRAVPQWVASPFLESFGSASGSITGLWRELLHNERWFRSQNHLVQGDGELSATSSFFLLWYQIHLSVDLLVSQGERSLPHISSWSLFHLESLFYIGILAALYIECLPWEKMELLHVIEILFALYLECPYY